MKLDASRRWSEHRLVALAAALHLPCPVREGFLFDPDHAFRTSCTESDVTLQRAIKRVFEHVGLPCDAAVVLWRAGATSVDRDGDSWFFEIDPAHKKSEAALGVILAREAARALLATRKVTPFAGKRGTADLELAAMLCGLGALMLRGAVANVPGFALPLQRIRAAYIRVVRSLGLGLARAVDVLPSRLEVALHWLLVSRRPLPYRALEPTVIIRCFCTRRLRVPTGAVGTTTCPACKRKRPFDGRACRIEVLATPRALPVTV